MCEELQTGSRVPQQVSLPSTSTCYPPCAVFVGFLWSGARFHPDVQWPLDTADKNTVTLENCNSRTGSVPGKSSPSPGMLNSVTIRKLLWKRGLLRRVR